MELNDIPLPAGFLFGMFPSQQESASGIIFPSFGEEKRRGFNLRNGGYFFDISEYVKLAVTGDIYSKGGHALYANSSYMKRYAYNGTVNFAYSKNPDSDDKIETTNVTKDFRLTWSHSPQWFAGAIAHDAFHAKLFRDGKQCSGSKTQQIESWTGKAAERACLLFQREVLAALGADPIMLEHVQKHLRNPTYQGRSQGIGGWLDYRKRWW